MISGLALETDTPLPISSGGSIATYSGASAAAAALVASLFEQITDMSLFAYNIFTADSISARVRRFSE